MNLYRKSDVLYTKKLFDALYGKYPRLISSIISSIDSNLEEITKRIDNDEPFDFPIEVDADISDVKSEDLRNFKKTLSKLIESKFQLKDYDYELSIKIFGEWYEGEYTRLIYIKIS